MPHFKNHSAGHFASSFGCLEINVSVNILAWDFWCPCCCMHMLGMFLELLLITFMNTPYFSYTFNLFPGKFNHSI